MRLLILGQGIAGTLLGWEFERAGIEFEIADAGHREAASRVGAGIINPITGQRLVKSGRVDALLPAAWDAYRGMEKTLGLPLVRRLRVWRQFSDAGERTIFEGKYARGELSPYVSSAAADYRGTAGFWIEPALHVDMPALIAAARRRWRDQGRLREERLDAAAESRRRDLVIDCTGAAAGPLGGVVLDRVKGELLTLAFAPEGKRPDSGVIHNRGHWLLPWADGGHASVGATYDRAAEDLMPLPASRVLLAASASAFLGEIPFSVEAHLAGWRTSAPDIRPVVGRVPGNPHHGYINGLGSKGALYAPWLARQWTNHLTEGVPFDPETDGARFGPTFRRSDAPGPPRSPGRPG